MFQFQTSGAKLPTWIPTMHQQWWLAQEASEKLTVFFCVFAVCISMHINSHSKLMWLIKGEGGIGGDICWHAHHTSSNTSSPSAPHPHPAQLDRSALILAGRTVMTSPLTEPVTVLLLMPSVTHLSATGESPVFAHENSNSAVFFRQ